MGWLTKILKGSSHTRCRCHEKHDGETTWERARNSDSLSDFDKEEIDRAIALSIAEEDEKGKKVIEDEFRLDEDEQIAKSLEDEDEQIAKALEEEDEELAKAIQESLNVNSPPRSPQNDHGSSLSPYPFLYPSGYRICAGCNTEIGHGRYLNCMGAVWHPECFRCHSCNRPISEHEYFTFGNHPYHKSCYKELHHPKCDVCKNFIPTNAAGLIEYRAHPFWPQKYCPSHEHDGTPRCCSCERMEISRRPRIGGYRIIDMFMEPYRLVRKCELK